MGQISTAIDTSSTTSSLHFRAFLISSNSAFPRTFATGKLPQQFRILVDIADNFQAFCDETRQYFNRYCCTRHSYSKVSKRISPYNCIEWSVWCNSQDVPVVNGLTVLVVKSCELHEFDRLQLTVVVDLSSPSHRSLRRTRRAGLQDSLFVLVPSTELDRFHVTPSS